MKWYTALAAAPLLFSLARYHDLDKGNIYLRRKGLLEGGGTPHLNYDDSVADVETREGGEIKNVI